MVLAIFAIIISYLVGSIPFAYIFVRLFKGTDIRKEGSGNVGFTNATRVIGIKLGIIVLLADMGKGILAVLLISKIGMTEPNALFNYLPVLCGLSAVIGHIWTIFLGFHGGKGVATSLGVFIAICPIAGLVSLGVWLIIVAITEYVSVGSMFMCINFSALSFVLNCNYFIRNIDVWAIRIIAILITIIVIFKHSDNIRRLVKGEERKFSFGRRS